ncbi:hypothetical protein [Ectobacillus ponti]|uniref:Uncharacterized protein n=1 Tax=Ectobacillus ponti TaxID=2961894 RepID=A0AA41XBN6_9BACI|nr:hypothetical protein [Ectobacillus ponti]MCP8970005.1 hypothetical protein [Ectobacillus ponti]
MRTAVDIQRDMQELQRRLEQLKQELSDLQHGCRHDFIRTPYMQMCRKCRMTESLSW